MKIKITFLIFSIILISTSFALPEQNPSNISVSDTAGSVVLPNTYSELSGPNIFAGPFVQNPRTMQLLVNESEMVSLLGKMIISISFRLPYTSTSYWPAAEVTYSNFDIYLSESVPPASRSFTFANNIVGIQKKVRSGGLVMPENSYTFGGDPNPFGREIDFDSAYLYTGGNLLIELRHGGFTGASKSNEAVGTTVAGYGTLFSGCWANTYNATTGAHANFSVVRLSASGLVGVNEITEIPASLNLKQNYPNPFNPVTNVEFGLPAQGYVALKIYNSLGKEVVTLVNQNLNAGTYKYDFDASDLSSGVYFYTLKVNPDNESFEFIQTKKMLLIK